MGDRELASLPVGYLTCLLNICSSNYQYIIKIKVKKFVYVTLFLCIFICVTCIIYVFVFICIYLHTKIIIYKYTWLTFLQGWNPPFFEGTPQNIAFNFLNCLGYWYRYWQKFYNWLLLFLEKVQTTSANQNYNICCQYFSCCYILVAL